MLTEGGRPPVQSIGLDGPRNFSPSGKIKERKKILRDEGFGLDSASLFFLLLLLFLLSFKFLFAQNNSKSSQTNYKKKLCKSNGNLWQLGIIDVQKYIYKICVCALGYMASHVIFPK
jgi:hypothetical protein